MKGAFDCVFYLNFTLKKKSVFSPGTVKKGYFYVDGPFFPGFSLKGSGQKSTQVQNNY